MPSKGIDYQQIDTLLEILESLKSDQRSEAIKAVKALHDYLAEDYDGWAPLIDGHTVKLIARLFPTASYDPTNLSVECIKLFMWNTHYQLKRTNIAPDLLRLFRSPDYVCRRDALEIISYFCVESYQFLNHVVSDQFYEDILNVGVLHNKSDDQTCHDFNTIALYMIYEEETYKISQVEKIFDAFHILYKNNSKLFYTLYELLIQLPIREEIGTLFFDRKMDMIIMTLAESNKSWKGWASGMCHMLMSSTKRDLDHFDIYRFSPMLKAYMIDMSPSKFTLLPVIDCLHHILGLAGFDYGRFIYELFKYELLALLDYEEDFCGPILSVICVLVESRDPVIIHDMIKLKFIFQIFDKFAYFQTIGKFLKILGIILEHGESMAEVHNLSINPCLHDLRSEHIATLLNLLDSRFGDTVIKKDMFDVVCLLTHYFKIDFSENSHLLSKVDVKEVLEDIDTEI